MSGRRLINRLLRGWPAAVPIAAAAILAGCATSSSAPRQVAYSCGQEPGLTIVFEGEGARILSADGPAIELQRKPSGSGFWYESNTHSIRGQGQSLTYKIGRMAPIQCMEVGT